MEIREQTSKAGEIINAYNTRNKIILDNLNQTGPNHNTLDFGCGFGVSTNLLAESIPDIKITGYDIDQKRVDTAKIIHWSKTVENVSFTSSIEEVKQNSPYDNIISSFVLEETGPEMLQDFNNLLSSQGILILFFYNIKGKDLSQFSFDTGAEKDTIKKIGLTEAQQRWSQLDTADYIKSVQDVGLTVLKTESLPQSKDKFAYLIAQKK
jgi:2-polyprenyl-3-methyl-5-hydroxy-6-metoxy-1,4-benzoquinol methylase